MERTDGVMRLDVVHRIVGGVGNRLAVGEEGVEEEAYTSEEEARIPTPVEARFIGRRGGVEGDDGVLTPSELSETALVVGVGGMRRGDGGGRVKDVVVVVESDATKELGTIESKRWRHIVAEEDVGTCFGVRFMAPSTRG